MAFRQPIAPASFPEESSTGTPVHVGKAPPGLLRYVPSLYTVATIAVLSAIFIIALTPQVETDFFWHLKVGQYIANHHVVPSRDFMSFTFAGHAWTDHEWLAEIGLFGLYQLAGLWGPIAFFAFVITATFSLVFAVMRERGVHPVLALFVLAAAFTASRGSWGPRIQMLSLLFVAIYMFALQRYTVTRDRRWLFVFPAVMLVWANVHAGFALGLVVLGISLAGELLNRLTHRPGALENDDLKFLGIALIGAFAITIVNPNGIRQLLYPLTFILPNAFTNSIQESASPNFHQFIMMVFEAMLLLLFVSLMVGRPRLNWSHLFFMVAFTHLALSQVRNVPLWMVVVSPLLALYLQGMGTALREIFPNFSYRRRPVRGRLAPVLNAVLLALVAVLYFTEAHTYISQSALDRSLHSMFPVAGVRYLETHSLPPQVLTTYSWGGYFLWNLYPHYRDFIDSRADTLYNTRMLNDYLTVSSGQPGWRSVIKRYGVQAVLFEPTSPLTELLSQDHAWKRVYRDSRSVIYTHR